MRRFEGRVAVVTGAGGPPVARRDRPRDGREPPGGRPRHAGVPPAPHRLRRRAPRDHLEPLRADGGPAHSAYHASKSAVRGYTETIAVEVEAARHRVGVTCVHPGGVATNIARAARVGPGHDHAGLVEAFDRLARTSPERAAQIIIRGIERRRRRVLIGADARVVAALVTVLGSRYIRVVAWVSRRRALSAVTGAGLPERLDRT